MSSQTLAEQVRAYLDLQTYLEECTTPAEPGGSADQADRAARELDVVRKDILTLLDAPINPSIRPLAEATRSYLAAQDDFNRCASRGAAAMDSPARRMERARRELEDLLQTQLQLQFLPEEFTSTEAEDTSAPAAASLFPRHHQMRILIALDRGEPAQWAFEVAADLAARTAAKVLLVHVLPPPTSLVGEFVVVLEDLDTKHHNEADALLHKFQTMLPDVVHSRTAVREGTPAEQILAAADQWQADLIVMGTHSRGRLTRLLLGSTAEDVIRRSNCPVITVAQRARWAAPLQELTALAAENARQDAHATTP
jgi:nucleotide-binding universal stress UspA family protein